jgi:hypothetical protein
MRYPEIPTMWRVFDLFKKRLGLEHVLIRYVMNCDNQLVYFNGHRVKQADVAKCPEDDIHPDHFRDSETNGGMVPLEFIERGSTHWLTQCFNPFKKEFSGIKPDFEKFWDRLMKFDMYSTRSFMASDFNITEGDFVLKKEAYPTSAINWLERTYTATGLFDTAFSEMVMDSLDFNYPTAACNKYRAGEEGREWEWWCLRYVA